ncbi:MAG: hypothetical protein WCF90_06030 [Methanomicrobiales archaeon]
MKERECQSPAPGSNHNPGTTSGSLGGTPSTGQACSSNQPDTANSGKGCSNEREAGASVGDTRVAKAEGAEETSKVANGGRQPPHLQLPIESREYRSASALN